MRILIRNHEQELTAFLFCSKEREAYHEKVVLATRFPNEFTSIIMDGMDQAKTGFPKLVTLSKSGLPMKTHLLGAKVSEIRV